jgi:hypothetical protein
MVWDSRVFGEVADYDFNFPNHPKKRKNDNLKHFQAKPNKY